MQNVFPGANNSYDYLPCLKTATFPLFHVKKQTTKQKNKKQHKVEEPSSQTAVVAASPN